MKQRIENEFSLNKFLLAKSVELKEVEEVCGILNEMKRLFKKNIKIGACCL